MPDTDLTKHAEAILKAAGYSDGAVKLMPTDIHAKVLTACAALFDAGARAMQDKCADIASDPYITSGWRHVAIRAIDPATLRDSCPHPTNTVNR